MFAQEHQASSNSAVFEATAITYSVIGIILAWLAAQARALKSNQKKWHIAIFLIWPLAFMYLGGVLAFEAKRKLYAET